MTIENNLPTATTPAAAPTTATAPKPATAAKPAAGAKSASKAKPAAKAKPAKVKPAPEGHYKVLTGIDDATFCARVSDHLVHGWKLEGNVAATFNGKNVILAQALVRKKKLKRKK